MLAEERFRRILEIIEERKTVSVQALTELLGTSESTIRRDLNILDSRGQLIKVFGGATATDAAYTTKDDTVETRQDQNREEKLRIAQYAAALILENDFVFLDAGTTTELVIDFLTGRSAVFVTNSTTHAKKLAHKGYSVFMLGGELKPATDAVVGGETLRALDKYSFTKGFFGTNGIHPENGYSTPDISEALVKERAMQRCRERFVLSDPSKFSKISPVAFGAFADSVVVTTCLPDGRFKKYSNIREVDLR